MTPCTKTNTETVCESVTCYSHNLMKMRIDLNIFQICSDAFFFLSWLHEILWTFVITGIDAEPLERRSKALLEKHRRVQARCRKRVFLFSGASAEIMGSYTGAKTNKGQRGHRGKLTGLHICINTSICMLNKEAFSTNATLMLKLENTLRSSNNGE